ncbi:hypothetical protein [Sphingomonas sp. RB1R13]|uniref:hypothetical protein n=1 Tax=Sphingomonas sp. RB1R13 TaxID=3096159 RepID=UPI002FC9B739
MLREAATTPGRYLFACLTTKLADEQAGRFRVMTSTAAVDVIHSECGKGSAGGRLAKRRTGSMESDHLVVFITHETLMTTDLKDFEGWHLRIDECLNATGSNYLKLSKSAAYYQAAFELSPFEAGWSLVRQVGNPSSWKDIQRDTIASSITDLQSWANRPADLLLNLSSFTGPEIKKRVSWIAVWKSDQLTAFATVTIAASNFLGSITHRIWDCLYSSDIEFRERPLTVRRKAQPAIRVHFFTNSHEGSISFWGQSEGRKRLAQIDAWMRINRVTPGYWSGNRIVRDRFEHNINGRMESPKLAGLNCLRDETSCAIFYSSKSVPADGPIMKMFDIRMEDIRASREDEDVFQFVCRGAIRNPDYGGAYDVYLYSQAQAERLTGKLASAGFTDVDCVPVEDAGMMSVERTSFSNARDAGDDEEAKAIKKREDAKIRKRLSRKKLKGQKAATSSATPIMGTGPLASSPETWPNPVLALRPVS